MMELWKHTFHDSDRYIKLVFDTYFTPENAFAKYDENRIIAALLSVPYEFQILAEGGKTTRMRGLYLCGLATHPDFRRKGIMGSLMVEAELSALKRGFDFTFLIPADQYLRNYYRRKGYFDASFRHSFTRLQEGTIVTDGMNIYSIKKLFNDFEFGLLAKLADWCISKEKERSNPTIIHSRKDMIAVMAENENSFFLTKEAFDLKYPILAKVVAVVFPEVPNELESPIRVVGVFIDSYKMDDWQNDDQEGSLTLIKDAISRIHPGHPIEFLLPCRKTQPEERGVLSYAMVKNLKTTGNNRLQHEVMTFEISLMLD